ncbi:hypothetical protein ABW20_dc0102080 [Dactylellina cionopaga]|nr:hypothetical protein ABW20_dc0102080 [Dactylellina cionopaga]
MKRAHRIGQTKPVYVETLILKGTIEETIFNRKNQMNENDFRGKKFMVDDEKLRNLLTKEPFVDIIDGQEELYAPLETEQTMFGEGKIGDLPEHPDLDIVTLKREQSSQGSSPMPPSRPATPTIVEGGDLQLRKKPKKKVGFAAEDDGQDDIPDVGPSRGIQFTQGEDMGLTQVTAATQHIDLDPSPSTASDIVRRVSLFGGRNGFFEDVVAPVEASVTSTAMQLDDSGSTLQKRGHECADEQESILFKRVKFVDAEV